MKRFRKRLLCALLAVAGMVATATSAHAGPMFQGGSTDNGNNTFSTLSNTGTPNPVVSFAVINTGSTTGSTAYLAGLAASTGGTVSTPYTSGTGVGQYVYLYEVVNSSPSTLGSLALTTKGSLYTAAGQISGTVFTNAPNGGGAVTGNPAGFTFSGNDNPGNPTIANQNYAVGNSGAVSLGTDGGVGTPGVDVESTTVTFFFKDGFTNGSDLLPQGAYTTLVYLVSNQGPTLGTGELNDTSAHADGMAPVASPEPQTCALMSSALIGLGGWAGWRRRFRKLS